MCSESDYLIKRNHFYISLKFNSGKILVVLLDYLMYLCGMGKKRGLYFFKDYFEVFFDQQTNRVKNKILWTLKVIEELDQVPENYLKHIRNSSGLYEIRIQAGNNIFRIFCFFDVDNLVVVGHGFQKKSQKTPKQQIERAEKIKKRVL